MSDRFNPKQIKYARENIFRETQKKFGKRVGYSQSAISKLESGKYPKWNISRKISDALHREGIFPLGDVVMKVPSKHLLGIVRQQLERDKSNMKSPASRLLN